MNTINNGYKGVKNVSQHVQWCCGAQKVAHLNVIHVINYTCFSCCGMSKYLRDKNRPHT